MRKLHQKFSFAFLWHRLKEVSRQISGVRYGDEVVRVADTLREATPDNTFSLVYCLSAFQAGIALPKIEFVDVVALNSERVAQFIAAARMKAVDEDFEFLLLSAHRVDLCYKK